ncbi:nucleotidyltransferase family protein [Paenibacillus tarimensis]
MEKNYLLDTGSFPKELHLLLAFIRMENDNNPLVDLKLQTVDVNWGYFIKLARHHRVYPLVYINLKRWNIDIVPAEVEKALYVEYCKNTFQMLKLTSETVNICKLFEGHKINSILLKGPVLAADLYGDQSLRTSKDIDILISIDNVDKVEQVLLTAGYILNQKNPRIMNDWKWNIHHLTYFHPQKNIEIEIHWRLDPDPGREPLFAELWQRRNMCYISGYPVPMLGREDLFFYLICHGARHGWFRLRWIADIDRLTKQTMDWEKVNYLLEKYHSKQIGGQALILSLGLLHSPLKPEMRSLVTGNLPLKLAQSAVVFIKDTINFSKLPNDLVIYYRRYLFSLKSNSQKWLYLIGQLYPNARDAKTLPLPNYLHFLYFPLRPVLWFWRRLKQQV